VCQEKLVGDGGGQDALREHEVHQPIQERRRGAQLLEVDAAVEEVEDELQDGRVEGFGRLLPVDENAQLGRAHHIVLALFPLLRLATFVGKKK
jgi:hypothetical protein